MVMLSWHPLLLMIPSSSISNKKWMSFRTESNRFGNKNARHITNEILGFKFHTDYNRDGKQYRMRRFCSNRNGPDLHDTYKSISIEENNDNLNSVERNEHETYDNNEGEEGSSYSDDSASSNTSQIYSLLSVEELQATCDHYLNLPLGSLQRDDVMRIYYIMKAVINKFNGVVAGKASEGLLKRVIDEVDHEYQQKLDGGSVSEVKVFNRLYYRVLDAWAKSEDVAGVLRAEQILLTMERKYHEGNKDVELSVYGFNCVIDGWARVAHKFPCGKAGKRAEALLAWMIELDKIDGEMRQLKPDIITMNSLINAWSKSPAPGAAQRAQDILDYMETCNEPLKPNDVSYTSVIVGWTNSDDPNAALKAESLLQRMESLASNGNQLVKPNVVTYSAVINAFSKDGSARKAEQLLSQMQKCYEEDLDPDLKPNVFTYNAVIRAWSLCRDDPNGAHRAELYLRTMERKYKAGDKDVKPDIFSYNSVLNSWAKSHKWEAVSRAEAILKYMEEAHKRGDLGFQPNTVSYTAVIDTYAKSGRKDSGEMASRVLSRMEDMYNKGNKDVKPNVHTMNTVIDAHAKGHAKGKAMSAYQVYKQMKDRYNAGDQDMRPNVFTYTTVLNACAFTFRDEDKEEALRIALATFEDLKASQHSRPSHLTYGTLIKVVSNLMKNDNGMKERKIKNIFDECCKDGQLGGFVLRCLEDALSKKGYAGLFQGDRLGDVSIDVKDLPKDWSENVKENKSFANRDLQIRQAVKNKNDTKFKRIASNRRGLRR